MATGQLSFKREWNAVGFQSPARKLIWVARFDIVVCQQAKKG
jgi:hypothetical protein